MRLRYKKTIFAAAVILQMVLLVILFVHFRTAQAGFRFSQNELLKEKAMQSAEAGYRISGNDQGSSRAVITPKMTLDYGIYQVHVEYDSDNSYVKPGDSATVWSSAFDVENQARYTVDSDRNVLPGYAKEMTYLFYVHENHTDVSIHNVLADDSTDDLDVREIRVNYLAAKTASYYSIRLLSVFVLIDILAASFLFYRKRTAAWLSAHGAVLMVMAGTLFIAEIPMLLDYFFTNNDFYFHCYRIQAIARGMEDGMFPVKIQPGWMNGYGYAAGVMYGDLFLYLPAILNIAGFPLHFCYRFYVLFMNCLTIMISWYSFRRISGDDRTGLACTVLYTLSVYRLCNLFTRDAVGEYSAMAFLPLVILGFRMIYSDGKDSRNGKGWAVLAAGFTGVLQTHVLTTLMAAFLSVVLCILLWRKTIRRKVRRQLLYACFCSVLLNLFFLVPFLDYIRNQSIAGAGQGISLENNTEYVAMLFSTVRTAIGESPFQQDTGSLPLSLGAAGGMIILLSVCILCRRQAGTEKKTILILLFLMTVSLWICTNLFPYRQLQLHLSPVYSLMQKMQFPWRFLAPATALVCSLYAVVSRRIQDCFGEKTAFAISLILCLMAAWQAVSYSGIFLNENRYNKDRMDAVVCISDSFQEAGGEYVPAGTDIRKCTDSSLLVSDPGTVDAVITERKGLTIRAAVESGSAKDEYVEYPLYAYIGYHATDSGGHELATQPGTNNRLRVVIPAGCTGSVTVSFSEPWYWRMSEIVSLLSLIWTLYRNRRSHEKQTALS